MAAGRPSAGESKEVFESIWQGIPDHSASYAVVKVRNCT